MFRRQTTLLSTRRLIDSSTSMYSSWQHQHQHQHQQQQQQQQNNHYNYPYQQQPVPAQALAGSGFESSYTTSTSYTSSFDRGQSTQMFVVGGFQPTRPVLQAAQQTGIAKADWMCICGYVNFATRQTCNQCQRRKEGVSSAYSGQLSPSPAAGTTAPREVLRGDWFCQCGAHNFSRRNSCVACGNSKPNVATPTGGSSARRVLPGDWICSCGAHNFRSRGTCLACGTASQANTSTPVAVLDWTCRNCQTPNAAGTQACSLCGTPAAGMPQVSMQLPTPLRAGDWNCPLCTFHNFSSRTTCKSCNGPRPENIEPGPPKSTQIAVPKPGDWQCQCGSQNFARRLACFGCGKSRQE